MANRIHERAVVGAVRIGSDNEIGPNCYIEDGAEIGSGNRIGPNVVIFSGARIGSGNRIHAGSVLGDAPQDISFAGEPSFLHVGDNNCIRENCTLHRGTAPGSATVIGSGVMLMANSHIAHNCRIDDGVITANNVAFGGYVEVGARAFVSGGVVVHQYCRIGSLAIISGLTAIGKDVPPYMLCMGKPGLVHGLNSIGLRRAGLSSETRSDLKQAFRLIYRSGLEPEVALEAVERECRSAEARKLVEFIRSSKRGIAYGPSAASTTGE